MRFVYLEKAAFQLAKNFILMIRARLARLAEKLDDRVNRNICETCSPLGLNFPRKDNGGFAIAD